MVGDVLGRCTGQKYSMPTKYTKEILEDAESNLKYLTTIGGLLPSTFSTFSYSKIKEKKKRLQGVDFFDRQVSRMQRGLIPSTKQHILDLEDEFLKYINT